jgi:hypothetical protein
MRRGKRRLDSMLTVLQQVKRSPLYTSQLLYIFSHKTSSSRTALFAYPCYRSAPYPHTTTASPARKQHLQLSQMPWPFGHSRTNEVSLRKLRAPGFNSRCSVQWSSQLACPVSQGAVPVPLRQSTHCYPARIHSRSTRSKKRRAGLRLAASCFPRVAWTITSVLGVQLTRLRMFWG